MSRPRLSVCIPTYNRAAYLPAALESFAAQIAGRDDIEVVVSDNASTDKTGEVVRSFEGRLPRLRYFRWDETAHVDRNILKVVDLSEGEYCWVLGDDDAVQPGAVQAVMDALAEGHDLYLTNSILYDEDWTFVQDRNALDLPGDDVFLLSDPSQRLRYCQHALSLEAFFGFISTQLFRRQLWYRSIASDQAAFDRFVESRFLHAWVLLSAVNSGPVSLRYLARPAVMHRWLRRPFSGVEEYLMDPGVLGGLLIDGFPAIARSAFGEGSIEEFHIQRAMRHALPQGLRGLLNWKRLETTRGRQGGRRAAELIYAGHGAHGRIAQLTYRLTPVMVCKALYACDRASKRLRRLASFAAKNCRREAGSTAV
jgi:glycosyltransferase involved in cell wall biosynthesis